MLFGNSDGLTPLVKTYDDLTSTVFQIQRVRVSLRAVPYDGKRFFLYRRYLRLLLSVYLAVIAICSLWFWLT